MGNLLPAGVVEVSVNTNVLNYSKFEVLSIQTIRDSILNVIVIDCILVNDTCPARDLEQGDVGIPDMNAVTIIVEMEMEVLKISQIIGEMGYGAGHPIHIRASDRQEYVLKTRYDGGGGKDFYIFLELLTYKIAEHLGFGITPKITLIEIDNDTIEQAEYYAEIGELCQDSFSRVKASLGINIAVEYIPHADQTAMPEDQRFIDQLIHLDNFVMNTNRNQKNPHILVSLQNNKKRYFAIDFGLGFLEHLIFNELALNQNTLIQETMISKSAFFNQDYLLEDFFRDLKAIKIGDEDLETSLASMMQCFPDDWAPMEFVDQIVTLLTSRMGNKDIYKWGCDAF